MTERPVAVQEITGLDHAIVGVRDLEEARLAWQRLGFTLSPRGRHIGWGTANYCIMLERDYIELLGILDPAQFTNNLDRFLETREGLLGLAFATEDAEGAQRTLAARGIAAEGPRDLKRLLELPEGTVEPAFKLVHLPPQATPGLSAFLCRHLTRELVWREAWTRHDNGARALRAAVLMVESPPALGEAYRRLFGAGRVAERPEALTVTLPGFRLELVTAEELARRFAALAPLPEVRAPCLAALEIETTTTGALTAIAACEGFELAAPGDGRLLVAPQEATGVILAFRPG